MITINPSYVQSIQSGVADSKIDPTDIQKKVLLLEINDEAFTAQDEI